MAVQFNGDPDSVDIPGPVTVTKNRTALTACFWAKFDVFQALNTNILIYSTGTVIGNARFNVQWLIATPGLLNIGGRATDGEGRKAFSTGFTPTLGVWTHIGFTVNYAASLGTLFVNGVAFSVGAMSAPFAATQTANTNSLDARISGQTGDTDQCINGAMEDVRLYDGALSDAEMMNIYTSRGKDNPLPSLLHRYPLNDRPVGTILTNSAGGNTTACIAEAERIVGVAPGAAVPAFVNGTTVRRQGRLWIPNSASRTAGLNEFGEEF